MFIKIQTSMWDFVFIIIQRMRYWIRYKLIILVAINGRIDNLCDGFSETRQVSADKNKFIWYIDAFGDEKTGGHAITCLFFV
jgi:hypothetical protein